VGAYNFKQYIEILKEKGLKYNPDLVIVSYTLNDASIPNIKHPRYQDVLKYCNEQFVPLDHMEKEAEQYYKTGLYQTLVEKSRLLYLITSYIPAKENQNYMNNILQVFNNYHPDQGAYKEIVCTHSDNQFWNIVVDSLNELKNISDKEGFKTILAIMPKPDRFEDISWVNYEFQPIHDKVSGKAGEVGLPVYDYLNDMRKYPASIILVNIPYDTIHFSEFGNRLMAISMYNHLIENDVLIGTGDFKEKPSTYAINNTMMLT